MVTSPFPEVGQGYSKMATVFADAASSVQSLQQQVGASQQGAAAEALMTRLQGHQRVLEAMHERCTTVVSVSAIQADADAALLQAPGPADVERAREKVKVARMAGNFALYKARMDELDAITDERHAALESHKSASERSDATLKSLTDIVMPGEHHGTPPPTGTDGDGGIEQGVDEDRDRGRGGFGGEGLPRDTVMPREHQGVEPRDTPMPRVHDGTPPPLDAPSTHLSSSSAAPPVTSPQSLSGMPSQPTMGGGAPGGGGMPPTMGLPQAVTGMGNGSAQGGGKAGGSGRSSRRRDEDDKGWTDAGLKNLLAEPAAVTSVAAASAVPTPPTTAMSSPTTHLSGAAMPAAPAPASGAGGGVPLGGGAGGGVPLGGGAAQHVRNSVKPPNITEVMPPEPLPGTEYADDTDTDGKGERKSA
ncbi:hypothetical protein [Mycolicibacter arupensis]|uniref:hypothetical protein n=1 Tax=Mycolicibacter arupensis TaxID=342002 RepID=UPI00122CFDAA|nr:hypothetical protein [Mycolicibacter arupensis]KAA1432691.1 hypothetical protein F0402_01540 [Mycolicibacter arupensis]